MAQQCKFEEWSIKDYLEKVRRKEIALPKFQRGISWKLSQQSSLISSILQGFPVGAILLARRSWDNNGNQMQIIDGLQRTRALDLYEQNPRDFLGTSDQELKTEWREFVRWVAREIANREISESDEKNFLKGIFNAVNLKRPDTHELYEEISRYFDVSRDKLHSAVELRKRAEEFFESLTEALDITKHSIPVILYHGESHHLPEIFERLNSQGVQLNKYEIFAAAWQQPFPFADNEVSQAITNFYKARLDRADIEIDGVGEDGSPENTTLFDFLTGLSTVLTQRFPILFASGWSKHIAYGIACVAHGLPIGEMSQLETKFTRKGDGRPATDEFAQSVLAICEDVSRALAGRLSMRLNARRDKGIEFPQHTEFQISTIITRFLVEYFDNKDWSAKKDAKARRIEIAPLVRRWYLAGRLSESWGNAGDSQFFRNVWESVGNNEFGAERSLVPKQSTIKPISDDELSTILDNWFTSEMKRQDRERESVFSETKLILRYFYFQKLTLKDEHEEKFELDHLVPITWWKAFFKCFKRENEQAKGPINSIGNLCLMTVEDNDSKHKKLPYDWFKEQYAGGTGADFAKRCKEWYFLIDEREFRYPELAGDQPFDIDPEDLAKLNAIKDGLEKTSRARWNEMKSVLIKSLHI